MEKFRWIEQVKTERLQVNKFIFDKDRSAEDANYIFHQIDTVSGEWFASANEVNLIYCVRNTVLFYRFAYSANAISALT